MKRAADIGTRRIPRRTAGGIRLLAGGTLLSLLPTVMARSPLMESLEPAEPMGWLMLAAGGTIVLGQQWLARRTAPASVLAPLAGSAGPAPLAGATALPASVPDSHRRLDAGVMRRLSAPRFCAVVEALYACNGFDTRSQRGDAGSLDIALQPRPGTLSAASVVRCLPAVDHRLDIAQLRGFEALLHARGLRAGSIVTAAPLTPDVIAFARPRGIDLIDFNGLLRMIARRPWADQKTLLAIALADPAPADSPKPQPVLRAVA